MSYDPSSATVRLIALGEIFGNPDQPRQSFDAEGLAELGELIRAQGLIQPITVTPRDGRFMIIAGERRYRAHVQIGAETIACIVQEGADDRRVMLQAIIENAMRRDVNLIEEATAYARCVELGMSPEDLARELGISAFRVRWRLSLLAMRPEYQTLARAGQITAAQALELAKLEPNGQDRLFRAIKAGECATTLALQSLAATIKAEELQVDCFGDVGKPCEATRRLAQGFEARVRKLVATMNAATVDNEVVAVRKVDPTRAATLADMFAALQGDLQRVESPFGASPYERARRSHRAPMSRLFRPGRPQGRTRGGGDHFAGRPAARVTRASRGRCFPGARRSRAATREFFRMSERVMNPPAVEPVQLANGRALQALIPGVAPLRQSAADIEREIRRRDARHGSDSMPAGGLFDDVARAQQSLF